MIDETHETPEASEATEKVAETEGAPETENGAEAATETATPKRDRTYVRVPAWAAVAVGAIVLAGGGFLVGRTTAPDDHRDDVRAVSVPSADQFPGFREIDPDEVPRPVARAFFGVAVEAAANGVSVIRVSSGSPAEDAGMKDGDIITKVDGKAVTTPEELAEAVRSHDPGDELTITYTRDGSSSEVKVRLDDRFAKVSPSN